MTLTPEEWVRQHYANYLVKEKSIPESRLMLESEIKYGKVSKRPDISVVDPNNLVFLIVECKAPEVELDQSVYDQTITYASVLEPKYLALTNGFKHIYFQFQPETKNFVSIVDIPCLL
ncbi:type I restriction enzyme HsdR N-terminal domain-containing protein [Salibacteraceae bacterium]|nr:type I restriction enzyme HsdR N-terminal domain-containing protein [Salibacteraceae bacterium]